VHCIVTLPWQHPDHSCKLMVTVRTARLTLSIRCALRKVPELQKVHYCLAGEVRRETYLQRNPKVHDNIHFRQVLIKPTPWSRDLLEKLPVTQLVKKFPPFMESECSSLCSQVTATGHSSEPHESNPNPPTLLPSIHFNSIVSPWAKESVRVLGPV
jgi:hypothetical protein